MWKSLESSRRCSGGTDAGGLAAGISPSVNAWPSSVNTGVLTMVSWADNDTAVSVSGQACDSCPLLCLLHISQSDALIGPRCCRLSQCEWGPDATSDGFVPIYLRLRGRPVRASDRLMCSSIMGFAAESSNHGIMIKS